MGAPADITYDEALTVAFDGCEVVEHRAGINREIGDPTYQRVHIEGTANVKEAAKPAALGRSSC